jgi:hypothetical protein
VDQGPQDVVEDAGFNPFGEPSMAGLVGREILGNILPSCAGSKNPEDAFKNIPEILGRPTRFFLGTSLFQQRFNEVPLLVSKFHGCSPCGESLKIQNDFSDP